MNVAKLALNSAQSAQKKFVALEKSLTKFERDWIKASRPKRKIRRRTHKAVAEEAMEETSAPTAEEKTVVTTESENLTQEASTGT